jgi:hypothetical protein
VVVWKLDRLSWSLKDLLHIMEKIGEATLVSAPSPSISTPPQQPGA